MHIFYIGIYQENESFNNIVANKTHKNKYLSRSVACDFRVANSVCVKNDGESSILNVKKNCDHGDLIQRNMH